MSEEIRGKVQQEVFDEAALSGRTIKEHLQWLVDVGESQGDIAKRFNSTKQTISAMFIRHDVKPKGCSAQDSMTLKAQSWGFEDLDDYLLQTGMDKTIKQQSEELGVSIPTISRYRAKLRKKKGM